MLDHTSNRIERPAETAVALCAIGGVCWRHLVRTLRRPVGTGVPVGAWRATRLRVYVDYSSVTAGEVTATRQQVRLAFGFYADGGTETVPQSLTFRQVSHPWLADIDVHVNASSIDGRPGCTHLAGRDSDGAVEYFTKATVCIKFPRQTMRVVPGTDAW